RVTAFGQLELHDEIIPIPLDLRVPQRNPVRTPSALRLAPPAAREVIRGDARSGEQRIFGCANLAFRRRHLWPKDWTRGGDLLAIQARLVLRHRPADEEPARILFSHHIALERRGERAGLEPLLQRPIEKLGLK